MIYHLSSLRNSIANGRNIDLSLNAMYQRENNWLRNNGNNNNNNNERRNYVRIMLNNNGFRRRRYARVYRYESNISFIQGFFFGIVLNIFSLFVLMIVRYRPKFKLGLTLGMIISVSFWIIANESIKNK